MTTVSTAGLFTRTSPGDVTLGPASEADEEKWSSITGLGHFIKSNLGNADQTYVDLLNGESYTLGVNKIQFLIVPPSLCQPHEYFHVRQKWEGYVIEVGQDTFWARLVPITGEGSDLEAEIYLEDVELPDRPLVEPGAVFYWSIGYIVKPSRNRYRASLIRFRRLPPWTRDKLEAARAKAEKLMSLLDEG